MRSQPVVGISPQPQHPRPATVQSCLYYYFSGPASRRDAGGPQLVESVIQLRRFGELRDGYAHEIAASCLRLIGLDPPAVAKARAAAEQLSPA
jgi:hypothetical protein